MHKSIKNKVKKYSYKYGIRSVVNGILIILMGILMLLACIHKSGVISDNEIYEYTITVFILLLGAAVLCLGVRDIIISRKLNKTLGGLAYNFDCNKEYKIYKSIGCLKKTNLLYFEKYMEWKKYVEEQYGTLINNENFYRFINKKYRNAKKTETVDKNIMIPLELLIPQIIIGINELSFQEKFISVTCALFIIEVILMVQLYKDITLVHFMEDFIEIIHPEKYLIISEK